jgi:hypothetical protein
MPELDENYHLRTFKVIHLITAGILLSLRKQALHVCAISL